MLGAYKLQNGWQNLSRAWQTSKIKWADRTLWEQAVGMGRVICFSACDQLKKEVSEANKIYNWSIGVFLPSKLFKEFVI